MKRRDFFRAGLFSAASLAGNKIASLSWATEAQDATKGESAAALPRRPYGKTDVMLSVIGMGGIVVSKVEQEQANRVVAEAVERGVNYFDVAPSYGDAESRLGPALQSYRKQVFLACKTRERRREGAEVELKRSLERLRTDHFDLYQLHGLNSVKEDVDVAFSKTGAMEVLLEAKRSGQVRFLGFSAHSVEAALAALNRYEFDSVLFPVNFACWMKNNFGSQVVERAKSQGAAVLALKALARQRWPKDDPQRKKYSKCYYQPVTDPREADLAVRFCLSQPVTAAIPPGDESLFRLAIDIASRFKPITSEEEQQLHVVAEKMDTIFPRV